MRPPSIMMRRSGASPNTRAPRGSSSRIGAKSAPSRSSALGPSPLHHLEEMLRRLRARDGITIADDKKRNARHADRARAAYVFFYFLLKEAIVERRAEGLSIEADLFANLPQLGNRKDRALLAEIGLKERLPRLLAASLFFRKGRELMGERRTPNEIPLHMKGLD